MFYSLPICCRGLKIRQASFTILFFGALLLSYGFTYSKIKAQPASKWRTLVLTDIENEPDDAQSLVRFLTYANQWDIEGIIATTSYWKKTSIADWRIHEILAAYQKVHGNLSRHEEGYPSFEALTERVKKGSPVYGMDGVGPGKDSEGSDWIIEILEKPDDRPLYIQVWGGSNCLAQALWKIRQTKSESEAKKLYQKIRVYTISDQDDTGPWIRKNFPAIFYICSPGYEHDGAGGYHHATWSGISGDSFHGRFQGANGEVISAKWLKENIQEGHGPLGNEYPDVEFLMEGDSPSFLYIIPNGLSDPEHPNYGSWGGRYEFYTPRMQKWFFEPETRPFWSNAVDEFYSEVDQHNHTSHHVTIWRWRDAYQNDFAARMDWCIKSYEEANHPPVVKLGHPAELTAKGGEDFILESTGSSDPDGDELDYRWFHYREPGSYKGKIEMKAANAARVVVKAPVVSHPQTAHFILAVRDRGIPALTRYRRVIVNLMP